MFYDDFDALVKLVAAANTRERDRRFARVLETEPSVKPGVVGDSVAVIVDDDKDGDGDDASVGVAEAQGGAWRRPRECKGGGTWIGCEKSEVGCQEPLMRSESRRSGGGSVVW